MSPLVIGAMIIIPGLILALPPFRKPLVAVALELLLALREMFIVRPLRIATGRRKPDYARIRELEIACGLIDPEPEPEPAPRAGAWECCPCALCDQRRQDELRDAEASRLKALRGDLVELAEALRGEKASAGEAMAAARFTSRLIDELERDIAASFGVPPHVLRPSIVIGEKTYRTLEDLRDLPNPPLDPPFGGRP